ncbi:phospholipid methyltransferase-domain-containing protein [Lipomyces japonicus]|uniref:phospholipid methyltransferase-domain-containing protein n=1 Tax=Lipomyces japonicus TaxID=56871 RepID=UPI0034CF996E
MSLIDFSKSSLALSAASVAFNPIFWNLAARAEYHTKVLTKLAGGNRKYGCYGLAFTIFSLGILRDVLYERALRDQPTWQMPAGHDHYYSLAIKAAAVLAFAYGNLLVVTSMWALGVTGTYLGDYFGILMDARVTGFPFNVTDNPMYHGSTLSFLGTALWFGKPAGLALTATVAVMYKLALRFEEPFTAEIYAKRDRDASKRE